MADRHLTKLIAFASLVAIATAYNASTPEPGSPTNASVSPYGVALNRTASPAPLPTTGEALQNSSRYDPDQSNSTASNSSRPVHPDHAGAINETTPAVTPSNSTLPRHVPQVNVTVEVANVTLDWLPLSSAQPPRNETDQDSYDNDEYGDAETGPPEAVQLDEAEETEVLVEAEEPLMLLIQQDADKADDANIGNLRSILGKANTVHVPVVEDPTTTKKFHVPVVEDTSPAAQKLQTSMPSTPHHNSTKTPDKVNTESPASSTVHQKGDHPEPESSTKGAVSVSSSFLTPLVLLATLHFLH
ncbi:hypothetical protein AAVH_07564 [Aphelenchoides avenae]|nr:hypothetical protein AAVH_07564 [Aphelenchus avenae]